MESNVIKVTSATDPNQTATVEFGATAITIRVNDAQPEAISPLAANALLAAMASYMEQETAQ